MLCRPLSAPVDREVYQRPMAAKSGENMLEAFEQKVRGKACRVEWGGVDVIGVFGRKAKEPESKGFVALEVVQDNCAVIIHICRR